MFYEDKSIKSESEDKLNRTNFARKITDNIIQYEPKDSLTIGILGQWGSGKSSLINLVKNKLKWEKDIIIVEFNPWFFSNQNNLYYQFFKTLILALKNKENEGINFFKRITTPQRTMFKNSGIISLNDYFEYISNSTYLNSNEYDSFDSDELEKYVSLNTFKNNCDEYFDNLNCKIIVIIDDIDRLKRDEIGQIFTLVKSLADFKNFIYILSFDKTIVGKSLKRHYAGKGNKFLDKIIQIPIVVPEINGYKLEMLIYEELSEIYDKHCDNYINKNNKLKTIIPYLKIFIKDLRDLKRYFNALNFYLDDFSAELNINDCFLVIALQLFEYNIFSMLVNYESIITSHPQRYIYPEDDNEILNNFYANIKKNLIYVNLDDIKKVLEYLFPKLTPSDFNAVELEKNNRIGNYKHFHKYFSFTLEENEVSSILIERLINSNDEQEIYKILTENKNFDYNHSLLSRLHFISDKIPEENNEILINGLIKAREDMHIYESSDKYFIYILEDLFRKIGDHDKSYKILNEFDYENYFFALFEFIYSIFYKYKENKGYHDQIEEQVAVNYEQSEKLKEKSIVTVKKLCNNGELLKHPLLKTILDYCNGFEIVDDIKKCINELIKNDEDSIFFICKFIVSNYTNGHYTGYTFDFDNLKKWMDLNNLNNRIAKINEKTSSDDIKKICKNYSEQYEDYKDSSK